MELFFTCYYFHYLLFNNVFSLVILIQSIIVPFQLTRWNYPICKLYPVYLIDTSCTPCKAKLITFSGDWNAQIWLGLLACFWLWLDLLDGFRQSHTSILLLTNEKNKFHTSFRVLLHPHPVDEVHNSLFFNWYFQLENFFHQVTWE